VRLELDWHERLKLAKLRFPTALTDPTATYELPYGHLERPADGAEEPGQSWVDVSGELPGGKRAGLTVVNDAKYAYDVSGGDLGITLARSPVYAWHEPRELDPDGLYSYQDQGRQRFRYLLLPHAGDWRGAGVVRTAVQLLQQPVLTFESFHSGRLPPRSSFAAASDGSVQLTVLKVAEDGADHVVLRGHETAGVESAFSVDLPFLDRRVQATFAPHEIKTLLVPVDPEAPVREANLLEDA
jgi:alpha-mannosidase